MKSQDIRLALVAGVALGLLLGCDDAAPEDQDHPAGLVGTWQETGQQNPTTVVASDGTSYAYLETSRVLVLRETGRFAETVTYACTAGACPDISASTLAGRWTAVDAQIVVSEVVADGHPLDDGLIPPRPYSLDTAGAVLVFEGARFDRLLAGGGQ